MMSLQNFKLSYTMIVVMVICSSTFGISCSSAFSSSSKNTEEPSSQTVEGGSGDGALSGVTSIEFDENNQATVDLSKINPDSSYIISLNSYDDSDVNYSYSLDVSGSSSESSAKAAIKKIEVSASNEPDDFDSWLRSEEKNLPAVSKNFLHHQAAVLLAKKQTLEKGSTRNFRVLSSFSGSGSYDTVSARLVYVSDDVYGYLDVRDTSSLSQSEIDDVVGGFSDVINQERDLFGTESDVNEDGHISILFTRAVNEIGGMSGGFVSGYFYGGDLYPNNIYSASNNMEVLYCMVPDPSGSYGVSVSKDFALSNILPSVLPHEFQHMINFNQHVFVHEGSSEESWLNEALSHLAEDIYSDMQETGIENPSRVVQYLESTDEINFTAGTTLAQRGGSYLFMRYLYEQAEKGNFENVKNGTTLLNRLLDTSERGVDNIVQAIFEDSNTDHFRTLLGKFSLALYFSDTDVTSDNHYQFTGINLHADQNDNRGTTLDGPFLHEPSSLPFSESLASSGLSYVKVTGQQLLDQGSSLTLEFEEGAKAGGYLMEF